MSSALILILLPHFCWGHPGGLDSSGGHRDRRNGGYHYHGGGRSAEPVVRQPIFIPPIPSTSNRNIFAPRTSSRSTARTAVRERDAREEIAESFTPSETPFSLKTKPDTPLVDRERQAQGKLNLGKQLIKSGRSSGSLKWFEEILQDFPETNAANEAGLLYIKISGREFVRSDPLTQEVDREKEARELLQTCKSSLSEGKTLDATRWLTELLLKHPDTQSAIEAKVLYKKLTGHEFERSTPIEKKSTAG